MRCRTILVQMREGTGVQILKGVLSKDHVRMLIEYQLSPDVSTLVKLLKGRSS